MTIGADDTVCGYPVLAIRNLLRRATGTFSAAFTQEELGIDEPTAIALLTALETDGYLEKVDEHGETGWRASVKGSALSTASDMQTEHARQARELAAIREQSEAVKRQLAATKRTIEEMADAKAKIEVFLAMTPEDREQHRDEITALLAKYR
jgi:hypothetical protein